MCTFAGLDTSIGQRAVWEGYIWREMGESCSIHLSRPSSG